MVAHNVETSVVERLGRPRREVEATRRRETEAVGLSDAVIAFTEEDRQGLLEMSGVDAGRVHAIPLGVDTDRIRPVSVEARNKAKASLGLEGKRVAVFIGALYEPNIQAVSALFDLASRMDRKELLFVVVGRVGELFQSNDRVRVMGQVDDVLPYFAAADLAVNPMRAGGGMQVKLLEFLAAGLPTVTTQVGARGLDTSGDNLFVVADVEQFPDAIEHLLKNEELAVRLGEAGRRFAEEHFGWDGIASRRVALYESLLKPGDRRIGAVCYAN
jgi:glycosyltransferase involved in cell wall biosynthesis